MQIGFASTDPGFDTGYQCHPEERISICLRGSLDRTIMDTASTSGTGDIVYMPGTMVHRDIAGAKGADCLDIYWPPRADIIARTTDRMAKYHAIIPADARPVLEHDGETVTPRLHFTEGPSWLNGCLYFSNMWFAPGFSSGDPGKSSLVRMCKDTIEIISSGMQTNGTMPLANGNLAVCDMFGHRLIEMNPNGGVVRTLATEYDGVRLDGPNDLVTDAKGGIYFTDPQFTPGLDKMQPGRAVYYRRPDGRVIRVVEPGGIGMPNGILLSPDGRTCYINNTRDLPVGNHLAAYDVNDDGALSNMRMFGTLLVPPGAREQEAMIIGADGMTMDTNGRIYVATAMGLQIIDTDGSFIGMVNFPIRPVSAVFGGDDMQTIYCTCATQIYSIRTNVKGLQYPLK
jgi:gluconolactonase